MLHFLKARERVWSVFSQRIHVFHFFSDGLTSSMTNRPHAHHHTNEPILYLFMPPISYGNMKLFFSLTHIEFV